MTQVFKIDFLHGNDEYSVRPFEPMGPVVFSDFYTGEIVNTGTEQHRALFSSFADSMNGWKDNKPYGDFVRNVCFTFGGDEFVANKYDGVVCFEDAYSGEYLEDDTVAYATMLDTFESELDNMIASLNTSELE